MSRAPTGSVRRLPSRRWQARFTGPDGVRRSAPTTFLTKADAVSWLNTVLSDISRGKWTPSEATVSIQFGAYAEKWLTSRKVKGRQLSGRTLSGYRDLLDRLILPTFGATPLHLITREMVEKWYDRTAKDKPTSKAHAYSLLRTILNSAVEDEHLATNPAKIRGASTVTRRHQVRPATLAELTEITDAMPPRYKLMIQLAAWCALRFGELTELRRADIDTRRGVIHVRRGVVLVDGKFVVRDPKSDAGKRDVTIPPHLLPMVREHLMQHTAPGGAGLLFPSRYDPERHLRESSMAKVYYPAREQAGRPDLRFHDLRHTGAVLAAQTGATLAELMSRLGHSTPSAAMRYQHAAAGRDAIIAAKLSAMIEQGTR